MDIILYMYKYTCMDLKSLIDKNEKRGGGRKNDFF